MKIGVISDTHIPDRTEHIPSVILNAFKQVDLVVHAGDMVDLQAVEELKLVCKKVVAVAGNMDREPVKNKYPVKLMLDLEGFKVGVIHGWGARLKLAEVIKDAFKSENPDIIIFGHSHESMNERLGNTLFFNPGSATDPTADHNSYGIIEIGAKINARIIKI
ncbi:MAG: metallophosphoesterase [Candidatus Omnitrophica bacterium]|nr:metallophosphoesterase [Candidatus Omnitrophota bacterium]